MMFGMERRRAGGTVSSMFTALFAFSIVLNLLAQVGARAADPASQLGSLVVDAVVGVTFAVCALVARKLSAFRSGWVMLAGSVLWTFGTLATAIDAISGAWAVLWALQGATDVIVIWLALGYPTGRLPTWWARSVVAAAALLYSFVAVTRLFLDDPGRWGTCDCVPNPVAVLGTERIYGTIEPVAVWGNLTIAAVALIAVIVRWVRGSAPWRAVNVLMTAVFAILVVVWITFDARWLLPMEWDGTGAVLLRSGAMTAIPVAYVAGLASLRSTRARVADLILATAHTGASTDDPDAMVLLDADLGILGADEKRYRRYAAAIRREYAHVADEAYRIGRAGVLGAFLKRDAIYRTERMHQTGEEFARTNLRREIHELTGENTDAL